MPAAARTQEREAVGHVVEEEEEERGTENKEEPSSILRSAWARRLDEVGRHESHGRRGEVRFFAFPVSVSILLSRRDTFLIKNEFVHNRSDDLWATEKDCQQVFCLLDRRRNLRPDVVGLLWCDFVY
jgi:hypothetical protein